LSVVRPGSLFFITDSNSNKKFLVDSGSSFSIIPHKSELPQSGPKLTAANGRRIACWGHRRAAVVLEGVQYSWRFLRAAVKFPILGADFLRHFKLLVDVASCRLLPAPPPPADNGRSAATAALAQPAAPVTAAISSPPSSTGNINDSWSSLLQQFSGVAASSLPPQPAHGVQHAITTSGPPVVSKFRRLDPERLAAARKEFDAMLKAGIVRRSQSGWSSPLHMVRKKDGGWRPCGDFRRLNVITAADKYPLPNMADLSARLAGCSLFTKLDLQKGYLQVPVAAADVPKTAVITPFGLFEFVRMPFGLKNAGMTFQRLMDSILNGLPFVFVYLDDILVASPCEESHRRHVAEVLRILQRNGLVINSSKCVFGATAVEFLGHSVTAAGISPLADRVAAIRRFPRPNTVRELQSFLGLINFYRRFVKAAAQILLPLTAVLGGNPAASSKLKWTPAMTAAFAAAKDAVAAACVLSHPCPGAELSLATDASASHVGAVLQQRSATTAAWQPLAFWSAKLTAAQKNYSTFDRELLAIFLAIRQFRFMLEGREFSVFTDHKPLIDSLRRISDPWSARQRRQLSYIAEFAARLSHISGPSNVVADTLSRPPAIQGSPIAAVAAAQSPPSPVSSPPVDVRDIAAAQSSCSDCQRAPSTPALRVMRVKMDDTSILVDVSSGVFRPIVPAQYRRQLFAAVHSLAHAGERATRRMLASRYVWPGLAADVKQWCKECLHCAAAKVTRQFKAAVQPIGVPLLRFSHIHVDLVGPLPCSADGFSHLFTIIDRSTRWCEAVPMKNTTAEDCAAALIGGWVSRFGVPAALTSDRGPQFTSAVWAAFTAKLGVQHTTTTAYHPQCNGIVERLHRRIKDALKARLASADWPSHLPWVLLGLRSCPREVSGISAAEMVYGTPLALPGVVVNGQEQPAEYFVEQLQSKLSSFSPLPPPLHASPSNGGGKLRDARFVFIRSPPAAPALSPAYRGPYLVLERGDKFFKVQIGGKADSVSVDRLKPYLGGEVTAADPPRRGRPPAAV
jgi:transposase InsO family protein